MPLPEGSRVAQFLVCHVLEVRCSVSKQSSARTRYHDSTSTLFRSPSDSRPHTLPLLSSSSRRQFDLPLCHALPWSRIETRAGLEKTPRADPNAYTKTYIYTAVYGSGCALHVHNAPVCASPTLLCILRSQVPYQRERGPPLLSSLEWEHPQVGLGSGGCRALASSPFGAPTE